MAKKKGGTIDLLVENYKAAKHLHVVLVPGCNEIGGPNGAGKSSGLDAAANIFGGTKLTSLMSRPSGTTGALTCWD